MIPSLSAPTRSELDWLYQTIGTSSIKFSSTDRIVSPLGTADAWILDLRRLLLRSDSLQSVCHAFWSRMEHRFPFQVGGLETAAIPLVAGILMAGRQRGLLPTGFVVRKERKSSGLAQLIEGDVSEQPIVIVDDIFNHGRSIRRVMAAMEEIGRTVQELFVVVDYESPHGHDYLRQQGITCTSLFRVSEFGLGESAYPKRHIQRDATKLWRFEGPRAHPFNVVPRSAPVVALGNVYYATDNGTMWCLADDTGRVEWAYSVRRKGNKNIYSTPAVHAERLYFGAYDGNVYCLDAKTGREIWRNELADWVGSSPTIVPESGLLIVGLEYALEGQRGSIAAMSLETGELVWHHAVPRYVHASPCHLPKRKMVINGANDGVLRCFQVDTGTLSWSTKLEGKIQQSPVSSPDEDSIFVCCAAGMLYSLDAGSGEIRWRYQTGNTINSTPLLDKDAVYVGSTDKQLHIVRADTGRVLKKREVGAKIYSPPRKFAKHVWVGTTGGHVLGYDENSYSLRFEYQFAERITNALAYSPERQILFVPFIDNSLQAIRLVPS